MLDVGSWMGLAAMTHSDITIKNVGWDDLGQIPRVFDRMGIRIERRGEDMRIRVAPGYFTSRKIS